MKFRPHILKHFKEALAMRHEPEGVRILSDFYWRTLLLVAFLVVVLVFIYGTWGLMRVLHDLGTVRVSTTTAPVLNRAALDTTIEGINARRAQFEFLKTHSGTTTPDPSR